jgi:5-deoxy-glucuronate isomerase
VSLLVKANQGGQTIVAVTPELAGWKHVGFEARRLSAGESCRLYEATRETCVVLLSGTATLRVADRASSDEQVWHELHSRDSVFEDAAPYALYAPPRVDLHIQASTDVEIGICTAPAHGFYPVRLIEPSQMKRSERGRAENTRYVCDILPQTELAEGLLVVEVRTPSGHSSSYPPHKHDMDNVPAESALEETYFHRIDPPQGFVFQRVYTDARDIDESMAVENQDVVMVPRGYHPVVVPYGYQSWYLNVMAGDKRVWHFRNDPAHEWMLKSGR